MGWFIHQEKQKINRLRRETNLPLLSCLLLGNRGVESREEAEAYLHPSWDKLPSPFLFRGMEEAVEMVLSCLEGEIPIRIIGDYDQDGVSATAILVKAIRSYAAERGIDPFLAVSYAIPDRIEDGYGMNIRLVDQAAEEGAGLIITCDNGIAAFEAVNHANELGIPVIVTDHHQLVEREGELVLPSAEVVLNPHDPSSGYPFPDLCGAGVAFKLIQAVNERLGKEKESELMRELVGLAALGTICDVVPLQGENRTLAWLGLKEINRKKNQGLNTLLQLNHWEGEVTAYTAGFVIGPCINASGRLMTARLGVELFLEEDPEVVCQYARELVSLNQERKEMTQRAVEEARKKLDQEPLPHVILLYQPSIHESICGLVAGRVREAYNRPSLVFTDAQAEGGEGLLKGSGRSIQAYDMYKKMESCRDLYSSFGGHAMACGLSLPRERLEELNKRLNEEDGLVEEDFLPDQEADAQLSLGKLDMSVLDRINELAPFGQANPTPVFAAAGCQVRQLRLVGARKDVLQLRLEGEGQTYRAVYFHCLNRLKALDQETGGKFSALLRGEDPGLAIDILYQPKLNEFRGRKSLQLTLKDLRPSRY